MILLNLPITTAVGPLVTPTFQLRGSSGGVETSNMLLQGNFTYGSGGTTANAYVQTSVDGGGTWADVANFSFATTTARLISALSLLPSTPVAPGYVPLDGALLANTIKDGLFGNFWRVKYITTGTYAGNTVLRIDANANGLRALLP